MVILLKSKIISSAEQIEVELLQDIFYKSTLNFEALKTSSARSIVSHIFSHALPHRRTPHTNRNNKALALLRTCVHLLVY